MSEKGSESDTNTKRMKVSSPKNYSEEEISSLAEYMASGSGEIPLKLPMKKLIPYVIDLYKDRNKRGVTRLMDYLEENYIDRPSNPVINRMEYVRFIDSYISKINDRNHHSTSFSVVFCLKGLNNVIINKLSLLVFFSAQVKINDFKELAKIYNSIEVAFDDNLYLKSVKDYLITSFSSELVKKYRCNRIVKLNDELFENYIEELHNTMSTIIDCYNKKLITVNESIKSFFRVLIIKNKNSFILNNFDIKTVIYCLLCGNRKDQVFHRTIENYLRAGLLWEFEIEEDGLLLQQIYQVYYLISYNIIFGDIYERSGNDTVAKTRFIPAENKVKIRTNIIKNVPKMDITAKKAFSPLSQMIGKARKDNDSVTNLKKLKF